MYLFTKYFLIICISIWICPALFGQVGNPFELEHKVSKIEKWDTLEEVSLPQDKSLIDSVEEVSAGNLIFKTKEIEGNPFELEHKVSRIEKWDALEEVSLPQDKSLIDSVEEISTDNPVVKPKEIEGNPFEIRQSKSIGEKDNLKIEVLPTPIAITKKAVLSSSSKAKINQFKIVLVIILLVFLALISTLLRHVVLKVFEGFMSDNLLRTYFRSMGRRIGLPNLLLEVFFGVNVAFSSFLVLDFYDLVGNRPVIQFLQLLAAVLVVVFGKHIVLFVIREVFPVEKQVAEYNFTTNVFFSILGLILLPCNLIIAFAPAGMATLTLYFMGFLIVLVLGYLAVRALLIGSKFLSSNRFHFFMYLCTVEIAPLFILIKVIKNYIGS